MRRIISLLLTVALIATMLPLTCVTAYATNYTTSYSSYSAPDASDSAHNGGKNSCTTVSEIKWMQAALNYCIKYKGVSASLLDVDGAFGPASATATKAFQRKYGLSADGWFGANTIAKMKFVLGGSTTSATTTTRITLNNQSATTAGSAAVTATYGKALPAITVPKRTGYTFGGYYTLTGGIGTQYYTATGYSARAWDKTNATCTLYAKWTANKVTTTVTLNNQSATTAGTTRVTATKGSAMPYITVPKKTGYTFGGYYTSTGGNGTQYYTASGYSARSWDKTNTTYTLYAKWTANKVTTTVTLNNQSATTAGTTRVTATKGSAMPAITVPKKTGYTFGGYYTSTGGNGTQYYTASGYSARSWDKTNTTYTLYAKWTANKVTTTVTLNNQSATTAGTTRVTATKGQAMPTITVPKKTGYNFGGYYSDPKCTGVQYYTELGRSARAWDKTASTYTLYAKWTPMTTKVTLDSQGADKGKEGTPSVIATYGEVLPAITEPRKEGYVFLGYYANKDGSGPRYDRPIRDSEGIGPVAWDIAKKEFTLYAKWTELDPFLRSEGFNRTAFDVVAVSVSEAKAKSNQENNAAYDEAAEARGYLIQQSDSSFYGKLLYGADKTHDNVGCELMAMYNALKLTGHPVSYSYLTFQAETTVGAQMRCGAWGTNPYKLGGIMERNGATVTEYSSAQALDEAMKVGSVAVVSTWNNGGTMLWGVHTYAVQKLEDGLWWYNYNTRNEVVLQSGKYVGIKDTVQATLEADNHYPAFLVGYIVK